MLEYVAEITSFHAHIYYDLTTRKMAERVRQGLGDRFEVQLGCWHDQPICPHPKSMYQVSFVINQFDRVVPWLMLHRENLDILIHSNTGDAVTDHTDYALWLGEKLPVKIEPLRQFNKSLALAQT